VSLIDLFVQVSKPFCELFEPFERRSRTANSRQFRMKLEAKHRQSKESAPSEKNGSARAQRVRSGWPKSDLRYWQDVVYQPQYRRNGEIEQSENYVVRIGFGGRRTTFPLGTSNRAAAGIKARDIYNCIVANGWDAAFARFKGSIQQKAKPVTVGEFLTEAQKYLRVRSKTFADYARALRLITAHIAGIECDNSKFDYQKGGHAAWLEKVSAVKLDRITPDKIRQWHSLFLARAKNDPVKLKHLRISANSFIRGGKALFSRKMLKQIQLGGIETSPFEDIEVEQVSLRYRSDIDFEKLLTAASAELANAENRELFKVFLLAACAGLRRNEIDKLQWSSFHFDQGFVRIVPTEFFEGKSSESHEDIYLDPEITGLFRAFRVETKGPFVVEYPVQPKVGAKYSHYRCQIVFNRLIFWLRKHGVRTKSPIHTLRKEYGSQLTKAHGIFVASRALRHSSVQVTEQFYASQKQRVSLGLGHLLKPSNVIEIDPQRKGEVINE